MKYRITTNRIIKRLPGKQNLTKQQKWTWIKKKKKKINYRDQTDLRKKKPTRALE